MSSLKTFLNIGIVILGGWICFYSAFNDDYFINTIWVVALLLIHLALVNYRVAEACIIIIAGITGSFVEIINTSFGFYHYVALEEPAKLLPTWIVLFWFLIGSAARHGLAIFYKKKFLLPVIGVGGAVCIYYAAVKSGVLHFTPANNTAVVVSIILWALAIMFILMVGNRFIETIQIDKKAN